MPGEAGGAWPGRPEGPYYIDGLKVGNRRLEPDDPTRFVHIFIFRDADAHRMHSSSAQVKAFAAVLYPDFLSPVVFTDYQLVDSRDS